ncbi:MULTISPECIES: hypothetical protein [unclassified Nocardioides]|jgi:Mce-associated membrane protein|uniref:hypothetical protein n=1 Tax=Nocardioides sp. URHA0032 TaxID=1380388 RepID=UPI0004920A58|nr:hypothetical protein [Nocardioides sp. URHA0032]
MTTSGGLGSRNPTGRPRKIAGQTRPVDAPADKSVDEPGHQPDHEAPAPPGPPEPGAPGAEQPRRGGRNRTTIALLVAAVVLVVVGALELVYLNHDPSPTVSASRPVVVGDATRGEAVETAARSTEEILSTTYENYDDQVAQATAKMTDSFAKQYQQTADGIRDQFIANKTQLQVKAVGQSVVQASPSQVQALLFLNQYVQKVEDGQPKTDFAQYRALVTVVHTDHGWLVSSIDTK